MSLRIPSLVAASIAAVFLSGLLILGCGGSSDDETATLSKAQVIKQGDAICLKVDQQRGGMIENWLSDKSEEFARSKAGNIALVKAVAIPTLEKKAEGLESLAVPSDDEEQIDQIVEGLESAVEAIEDEPDQVEARYEQVFGPANETAKAYGFKVCSKVL